MYESHEKLKGMKTKSADLGKTLREKRRELEDEQRKNQLLERDVERFKNRQKYMSRIGHLKKKKLWVVSEGYVYSVCSIKKYYVCMIMIVRSSATVDGALTYISVLIAAILYEILLLRPWLIYRTAGIFHQFHLLLLLTKFYSVNFSRELMIT